MRRGAVPALTAVLVAGPTVLAFASGGFFPHARLVAAIGAWAVLGLAALVAPAPVVPRTAPARAALLGLAALAGWTALSGSWAPSPGPARQSLELALVYLPTLAAAALLLRARVAARFAEVALAGGTLVVIGYGLAGRLLPGLVHGVYLSFSRGALAAAAVALVVLVALRPTRPQAHAAAIAAVAAGLAIAATAPFAGVRALEGSLATREAEGIVCLALLLAVMALAAAFHARTRATDAGAALAARPRAVLLALALGGAVVPYAAAVTERTAAPAATGASAARLTQAGSNRGRYWAVAVGEVGRHPLRGIGAGGFGVAWLEHRTIDERVPDPPSLYL